MMRPFYDTFGAYDYIMPRKEPISFSVYRTPLPSDPDLVAFSALNLTVVEADALKEFVSLLKSGRGSYEDLVLNVSVKYSKLAEPGKLTKRDPDWKPSNPALPQRRAVLPRYLTMIEVEKLLDSGNWFKRDNGYRTELVGPDDEVYGLAFAGPDRYEVIAVNQASKKPIDKVAEPEVVVEPSRFSGLDLE